MNLARLAATAAILTSLSVGCAVAKPAVVNLRKGPGTDSEIITLIPKGTQVEVGTCTNGWCQVSWNGMDGLFYCHKSGRGNPAGAPSRDRPRRISSGRLSATARLRGGPASLLWARSVLLRIRSVLWRVLR
jgi:hypothetical protein